MKEIYSIWGMPSSSTHGSLVSTIKQLASEHGSTTFSPHITIIGDTSLPKNQLVEAISKTATFRPEVLFKLGKIDYSQNYYKAVFVNTIKDQELRLLRNELLSTLSLDNSEYKPHISLLYGIYALSILSHIASNIIVPDSITTISRLDLVPITPDPREWEAIYSTPINLNS